MAIELGNPAALWLLLALPFFWLWPRPSRDARHGALRSAVVALLVLAIAAPTLPREEERAHQVAILDATASVDSGALVEAAVGLVELARRADAERTVLVTIGGGTGSGRGRSPWDLSVPLAGEESPLGRALAVASAQIPRGARGAITLASDGHSTARDWGEAAQSLAARGIPVHVVPLPGPPEGDLRPVGLAVAEPVRAGGTAIATIDLIGDAIVALTLLSGERVLAEREGIAVAGRARVEIPFEPDRPGFLPLAVSVRATGGIDASGGNERLETEIAVQEPLRVLHLGAHVESGGERLADLLGPGFALESESEDASADAESLPDLDRYDLVILDDRPAATVPAALQEGIAEAVREKGLGLAMTGGAGSFGPGGWEETPLAALLPVEMVQKEEKKDPSVALAVIIDTSGSMAGNRIVLAKEVARLAIRRLLPHDKVGIVEFYGTKRWAAPIQSAANAIDIQRALNRLDASGGTILLPAIEEAYYGLRNVDARYKHVLVLTDAGVESGPYESLLRRMARDGIHTSTVLVGPARHGELLVELADWGSGRAYHASDRFNLPEVLLKQPSTARLPAYRPGTHELEPRGGRGWWGEVDPRGVPPLAGYVESRARPGAEVLLGTREEGHPVLASWHAGLGRATAFLTEPVGPGTATWREWRDYGAFLARALARTARADGGAYRFSLAEDGARLEVIAERREPSAPPPRGERLPDAGAGAGDGSGEPLDFLERAPGRFVALLDRDPAAAVRIIAGAGSARGGVRLVSPARAGESPERQVDPARALDLPALAAATGGQVVPPLALRGFLPPAGGGTARRDLLELAPLCLALALLAFLAEIFYRRSRFHRGQEAIQ